MLRTVVFASSVSSDHDTLAKILKSYSLNALLTIFESTEEGANLKSW